MKIRFLIAFIILGFLTACGQDRQNGVNEKPGRHSEYEDASQNETYKRCRAKYDPLLTDHFPSEITDTSYSLESKTDRKKDNIGILLYNYFMSKNAIDSIKNSLKRRSLLAEYKSSDSCLLIINPYESRETSENGTIPDISDKRYSTRDCYDEKYPLPNFVDCKYSNSKSAMKLDSTFTIYVFEARSGKYFPKYEMPPSTLMPGKWKNGYSKGIAISDQRHAVIYWAVIW